MKERIHECHYSLCTFDELSADDQRLVAEARQASLKSYAPYSHFHVGAALRLADGTLVIGSNQENAAYPSGLCAERTALFTAGANHPDTPVEAIAIAASNEEGIFTPQPTPPCGACRQVMLETETRFGRPMRILLYGTETTCVIAGGATEILPLVFDGSFLR